MLPEKGDMLCETIVLFLTFDFIFFCLLCVSVSLHETKMNLRLIFLIVVYSFK